MQDLKTYSTLHSEMAAKTTFSQKVTYLGVQQWFDCFQKEDLWLNQVQIQI
jgi:hypothetical protein